ncbi:hypothetical protein B484DRAFT_207823 [Ochromonadaceae sp. CCMP2298]|nr:hypothetical protein B484DRAFT_207823 [Ochromonadaceae sp. CCMP2298]
MSCPMSFVLSYVLTQSISLYPYTPIPLYPYTHYTPIPTTTLYPYTHYTPIPLSIPTILLSVMCIKPTPILHPYTPIPQILRVSALPQVRSGIGTGTRLYPITLHPYYPITHYSNPLYLTKPCLHYTYLLTPPCLHTYLLNPLSLCDTYLLNPTYRATSRMWTATDQWHPVPKVGVDAVELHNSPKYVFLSPPGAKSGIFTFYTRTFIFLNPILHCMV